MSPIPIPTIHLFPKLDEQLITLLKSLSPEDWDKSTLAGRWRVKDIAAHLLDGNIRTLSIFRDGYFGDPPSGVSSYQDLVNYLNRLNADWVQAMKRVSPAALIQLLETSGSEYHQCLLALNPFEKALFAVDWAGESESQNWFHIAREYTEKWHHQKQIREAVGVGGLMEKEFYQPLIQTFMQALPHAYRNAKAPENTTIMVVVTSEAGGSWCIQHHHNKWTFTQDAQPLACRIEIDPDTAWKLFTKGLSANEAQPKLHVTGQQEWSEPLLRMLAVMA